MGDVHVIVANESVSVAKDVVAIVTKRGSVGGRRKRRKRKRITESQMRDDSISTPIGIEGMEGEGVAGAAMSCVHV